ncbi:MAG: hypothetical protein MUO88_14090, partial [Desulfobacterales bacterium]|nr:hypothetical protein [Desulfobacterales bacterium]
NRWDNQSIHLIFIWQTYFAGVAFFCNFVRNTIYVLEIEVLGPVVLARYRKDEILCNWYS